MKTSFLAAASAALVLISIQASAQTKDEKKTTATRTTSDYSESSSVQGDQVVEFKGDELGADGHDIFGGLVKAPPRTIRAGLLLPRMNFVPELLKSVENL